MKSVTREFRLGLLESYKRNRAEQEQQLAVLMNDEARYEAGGGPDSQDDTIAMLMNKIMVNDRIIQELQKRLD